MIMRNAILPIITALLISLMLGSCATSGTGSQPATKPNKASITGTSTARPSLNQTGPDEQHVQSIVNARHAELTKIYQQESSIIKQNGSLKITLYILENGTVVQADMKVVSGDLKQALIDRIREQVKRWTFTVRDKVIYSFTVRFERN